MAYIKRGRGRSIIEHGVGCFGNLGLVACGATAHTHTQHAARGNNNSYQVAAAELTLKGCDWLSIRISFGIRNAQRAH